MRRSSAPSLIRQKDFGVDQRGEALEGGADSSPALFKRDRVALDPLSIGARLSEPQEQSLAIADFRPSPRGCIEELFEFPTVGEGIARFRRRHPISVAPSDVVRHQTTRNGLASALACLGLRDQ